MSDFYLANPSELQGQPKRTIAEYVESNGLLVPRRFGSLQEAKQSSSRILLRSEHPQEYAGVSGLLDSLQLSGNLRFEKKDGDVIIPISRYSSVEEIKEAYFNALNTKFGTPKHIQYCQNTGQEEQGFIDQSSFSLWELLEGYNRTVVADSAIEGRYHVMTTDGKEKPLLSYAIFDKNGEIQEYISTLPQDLRDGLVRLVNTYEEIRTLGNFDLQHCPIMEFQTHDGKDYFLQYHRSTSFNPTTFSLERELKKGEQEVQFVRGATPPQGRSCKVTLRYAWANGWKFDPQDEEGSFDFHWNRVFSELQVRKRVSQFIHQRSILDSYFAKLVVGHDNRSKLFKPQISLVGDFEELIGEDGKRNFKDQNISLDIHIISDGKRAFVSRI